MQGIGKISEKKKKHVNILQNGIHLQGFMSVTSAVMTFAPDEKGK